MAGSYGRVLCGSYGGRLLRRCPKVLWRALCGSLMRNAVMEAQDWGHKRLNKSMSTKSYARSYAGLMRVLCGSLGAPVPKTTPEPSPAGLGFAESYAEVLCGGPKVLCGAPYAHKTPAIRLRCRFCLMRLMGISKKSYGEKLVSRVLSYAGSYAPMPIRPNEFCFG